MKVFKFGGASVQHAENIRNVANILRTFTNEEIVVVVSAIGKTTNALEKVTEAYCDKNGKDRELLQEVKDSHAAVMKELFTAVPVALQDMVNNIFVEIEWILEDEPAESYDYLYDQIVSMGEMLSSNILNAYLNEIGINSTWLDAREVVKTDNTYREPKIEWELTEKLIIEKVPPLLKKGFIVTQGFVGCTSENFSTTLGRESSDYTTSIFGYSLSAESVSIWKDVPGVLTDDPRFSTNYVKIDHLSYHDAIEMTYYGAKVIHPKTIKPLQNRAIPLHVRSFIQPEAPGTVIDSSISKGNLPPIHVVKRNQYLITIATKDFSFITEENLSLIYKIFASNKVKINMMQNSAISFFASIDFNKPKIMELLLVLKDNFHVETDENLELRTIRYYTAQGLKDAKKNHEVIIAQRRKSTYQMLLKAVAKKPVL